MKKELLFLLFCCFLSLDGIFVKASPLSVIELPPPCTLAAPANLQYTSIDPYTIQFTWDPVPGAVGYRSVLTNLSNGSQSISVGPPPNATYTVEPGDYYEFTVAAMCSLDPPETSNNRSSVQFRAPTIIIELVVKVSGCTPTGEPIFSSPASSDIFTHIWSADYDYYIELVRAIPPKIPTGFWTYESSWLIFEYSSGTDVPYKIGKLSGPGELCGYPINTSAPPPCEVAPVPPQVSGVKFTSAGRTCRITFPTLTTIRYKINQGEQPFDFFRIYEGCGGERSDQSDTKQNESLHFSTANPFSDNLMLRFAETLEEPIQTRLFDLQGTLKTEAVVEPDQIVEGTYSLVAENLPPGMYFLQVETLSGQKYTRKLLKI